jgi:potassium/chloride transporter 9
MTTPHQSDIKGVDNGERQRHSVSESHDGRVSVKMEARHSNKLGSISGVYIPVFLNIMSILMFLRFGLIIGKIGFVGILGKPWYHIMVFFINTNEACRTSCYGIFY